MKLSLWCKIEVNVINILPYADINNFYLRVNYNKFNITVLKAQAYKLLNAIKKPANKN